ncbi:Hsp20 family protein [Thermanaerosceptrum fracticalcis]|uniref:Hsp20 family protein n=1 Tax=Thermanaerosceptrum fracticalcis TaxID=1712410 RepID=A0A7G6E6W1_THEFR|nr:Hsp20/alpha crystallin family protein [Thermanaerosceptrum fracticalcis]QNB47815.1 Hsp20 family protein [Thermanaerosceptrum fracticalcis]
MFGLVPYRRNIQQVQPLFDFENIFENFFNDSFFPALMPNAGVMNVDIKDTDNAYILEADIPGVNKENIRVEFKNDQLTIGVEHNEQHEEKKENYIRKERSLNIISRTFVFENIDSEKITARYENGVLTVTLPKKEAHSNGYRIPIS